MKYSSDTAQQVCAFRLLDNPVVLCAEQRLAAGKLSIPASLHEGLRGLAAKASSSGPAPQPDSSLPQRAVTSITPEAASISSTSPTVTSIADVQEIAQMSAMRAEHAEPATSNSDAMPAEITGQQQQAFEEDVQVHLAFNFDVCCFVTDGTQSTPLLAFDSVCCFRALAKSVCYSLVMLLTCL